MNLFFIILLSLFEVLLCTTFLLVMFEDVGGVLQPFGLQENGNLKFRQFVTQLLGVSEQNENSKYSVLRVLGFGMGGILLALQALIANRRAKAMQETAKAQVKANKHTERGQQQERLKNAIEHLGNASESMRLGGTYELFHLAKDNPELSQTLLDILCAHIRTKTGEPIYQENHQCKPSVEIQSILSLLFRENPEVFGDRVDLKESWLKGADLKDTSFPRAAILTGVHLQGAELQGAQLQEAELQGAQLQGAYLQEANLEKADLQEAQLQGADLQGAQLQEAYLQEAQLQRAYLQEANLEKADLQEANLEKADLRKAKLESANLRDARLEGALIDCTDDP